MQLLNEFITNLLISQIVYRLNALQKLLSTMNYEFNMNTDFRSKISKTPEYAYDFIFSMTKTNFGVTHYDGCGRDIFFLLHLTSTDDYKRT